MNSAYFEPNSDYTPSGYNFDAVETSGYSSPEKANQGNFDNAYQENIYDLSNLADNAWTDSVAHPNPQLELELN